MAFAHEFARPFHRFARDHGPAATSTGPRATSAALAAQPRRDALFGEWGNPSLRPRHDQAGRTSRRENGR